MGSQALPAPLYQYRLILPMDEDKGVLMCSTDMDFNIEAEAKYSVAKNILMKSNYVVSVSSTDVFLSFFKVMFLFSLSFSLLAGERTNNFADC